MAVTWTFQTGSLDKTVFGNRKIVMGGLEASGTYTNNGDAYDIADVTDGFITTETFPLQLQAALATPAAFWFATTDGAGKILIFGSGGAASHTHTFTSDAGGTGATGGSTVTIPVTAGTAGDAVTNNAGTLESTGGQDLTSASHTHTGPSHTHTGTTAAGAVAASSALVQLAAGTNITGWTIPFIAFGY